MTASRYDVVILAATPAGICAAIAATRMGCSVVILERGQHIGGLPANGLGITDIATRAATGGLFKQFIARIREHYVSTYGEGSKQAEDNADGYRFEPHVAERVLEAMLAEHADITVLRQRQFDALRDNVTLEGTRLKAMTVTNLSTGNFETYEGDVFIDAGYEGDLAAAAGAPVMLGREGRDVYDEVGAGRMYWSWTTGEFLEGSTFEGDDAIQAYNYRFCLTRDPSRFVAIEKPDDYRRGEYLSIIDDVASGRLKHGIYRYPRAATVKPVPIPNEKYDVNDHPKSLIGSDLPEENWPWATADWAWRDRFAQRLRDYTLGMLWFCQHDDALPQAFREDSLQWGLASDAYEDNGFFPRQVYVREARRVRGEYVFTANDCIAPGDRGREEDILAGRATSCGERPPIHADAVTAAHYPIDSHACHKREPGKTEREGYFAFGAITQPYHVPYRVMVPLGVEGLLVATACSASHMGFGTLRMEPCWMALGEAAGAAAALAIRAETCLRRVDVSALQDELLARGAVLIYLPDGDADAQRAALRG